MSGLFGGGGGGTSQTVVNIPAPSAQELRLVEVITEGAELLTDILQEQRVGQQLSF